ncbi:hypothetical protein APSETT445_002902 [Aspergillus pseudonomiae]
MANPLAKSQPAKLSPEQLQDILEGTLSDIHCAGSSAFGIVGSWATETGLARIREIVEADFARSYSVTRLMFDPHCVLFLRLISYISREEIQRSLILEKDVGTIFNVIYGPRGDRGVAFFRQVVGCLVHLRDMNTDVDHGDGVKYEEVLLHVTEAILSTILQIQEATFKSELKGIVDDLQSCSPLGEIERVLTNPNLCLARENMLKIQDIFGTGDRIAAYVPKADIDLSEQQQQQHEVDPPGELSKFGPRHNNDHASISNINILPTLSEILHSQRLDFLPTRDSLYTPDGHHEKGVRRLLDTHFRLLREDTSGVLRDAVRVILDHWETLVHGARWQEKKKILRTHSPTPVRIYYGAQIRRVKPDRVKGMEIDVEFDQVARIKNMTPWKRKHYWRESRALNEGGALLALIDAEVEKDTTIVFLQVSRRYIEPMMESNTEKEISDLFLQGLLDSGISKIVRIGSRSASPALESLSLENYKKQKKIPRIPGQGRSINLLQKRLDDLAFRIGEICKQLENGTPGIVSAYLRRRFPKHDIQITEGVLIGDRRPLDTWSQGNGPGDLNGNGDKRQIEQLLSVDPWTLTNEERTRLLRHWHESAVNNLTFELDNLIRQHAEEKRQYTALFNIEDAQIFNQVEVVGVTTTGLANNADLLRSLPAKVLICEEAGEVLESHILTSFLPSIQHAILIGDHLQLRPKISNQRLSIEYDQSGPKYNLDESLFERMVNLRPPDFHRSGGQATSAVDSVRFPVAQLDSQRRMHPSIASLVRQTLYPDLCDHPKTSSYDEVAGLKRRLFWLDHRNIEDPDDPEDPMRSKTNTWEADVVIALVQHLCKQERYSPGEIAILTPYIGQLRLLRNRLEGIVDLIIAEQDLVDLDDSEADMHTSDSTSLTSPNRRTVEKARLSEQVRLATVDNFQKYCQECGSDTVLDRCVDLITLERYGDINVNEDRLIFLSCGHYYTVSSLDGIMEIKEYYNVDPHTDAIVSPRLSRRVVSDDAKLPGCPECRIPLRDIHRYNRIVKKALLDESTKRFIVTANLAYKRLVMAIEKHEAQLEEEGGELIRKLSTGAEQSGHSHNGDLLKAYCKKSNLEKVIQKFVNSMTAAEQPYGRVNNLLASAAVGQNSVPNDTYNMDDSKIQTGFHIRGQCLQLRLAWAILWGYRRVSIVAVVDSEIRSELRNMVVNRIKGLMDTSISVRDASQAAKLLSEQVQAMIYYALFCILYLSTCEEKGQPLDMDTATKLRQNASDALEECDALRVDNPGTLGFLQDDIEKAKRLLDGGTFYSFVTTDEKRQVLRSGNVECRWKQPDVLNAEKALEDTTMSPFQASVARMISSKRLGTFRNV